MVTEPAGRMPWCHGLDDAERGCLLALLRKMVAGTVESSASHGEPGASKGGHE